jgi:Uma2 family endonuclease
MSLLTTPQSRVPVTPRAADPPRRWTLAELDAMVAAGILEDGGPEYLWDGMVCLPFSEGIPHDRAVDRLRDALLDRVDRAAFYVRQDHPLVLAGDSNPEPDFVIARGPGSTYDARQPGPRDVALLIEVAQTTYPRDAGERLQKYAAVGIPLYWIVNLIARRVEVYRGRRVEQGLGVYDPPGLYTPGDAVPLELTAAPGEPARVHRSILVDEILGVPAGGR